RVFLVAVPVSVISIVAALFIRQVQLRSSNTGPADAAGSPEQDQFDRSQKGVGPGVSVAPGEIH
ncbi:MAG: hypothetical protein QOH56_1485, partial [Pseudonocardiales bacterium]|nr:hypothetical protein [Pseudonocardiales bacterium]